MYKALLAFVSAKNKSSTGNWQNQTSTTHLANKCNVSIKRSAQEA